MSDATARRDKVVRRTVPGLGPALDDSFGFLVADTARHVRRVLSARLAQYGIPGGCWFALRALWLQDGSSQRELSESLGLAEPVVVMTLRALERLGLVTRERDEADRRRMRVLLTQRARELQPKLLALAQDINCELMSALPEADRAVLIASLRKVRAQLVKDSAAGWPLQAGDLELGVTPPVQDTKSARWLASRRPAAATATNQRKRPS